MLFIIMYHYIRCLTNSRYPGIKGLELSMFYEQIDFLKQNFSFVSMAQVSEALDGKSKLPQRSVLLTFDDGYIDHYTNVFPILKKNKIPAFFSMPGKIIAERKVLDVNKIHFVLACTNAETLLQMIFERLDFYRGIEYDIPDNRELYLKLAVQDRFDTPDVVFIKRLLQVELEESLRNRIVDELFKKCVCLPEDVFASELYLNLEQVELMAREGMDWGIHGYEHYWMDRLSDTALETDIMRALDVFGGVINRNSWVCCYPYGAYNEKVLEVVRSNGATVGLSTKVGILQIGSHNRYALPRLDTNDFPPKSNKFMDMCLE